VARTRHELLQAFTELMKERGWDDIRDGDVCARAGLARSTFYAHHASKESLLSCAFGAMREELESMVEQHAAEGKPFGYARALLHNALAHPRHHRLLVDRRTDHVVQRRFLTLVKTLVAKDLAPLLRDKMQLAAATHYMGGGLFELMTWGVNAPGTITAEVLVAQFLKLVIAMDDRRQPTRQAVGRGAMGAFFERPHRMKRIKASRMKLSGVKAPSPREK